MHFLFSIKLLNYLYTLNLNDLINNYYNVVYDLCFVNKSRFKSFFK